MQSMEYWNVFYKSGKIEDYLKYSASILKEGERPSEIHDRRIDNQRDQRRRK